ncbi:MAG: hypothetical protein FWC46_08265, partial [Actinomycetia bacterium]|nr:hypothetical protein [Actinomycetes bacterium]
MEPRIAPGVLRRWLSGTTTGEGDLWEEWLPRILWRGEPGAAVVIHTEPLVVAAYSPVFDTCVLLDAPPALADPGRRLLFGTQMLAVTVHLPGPVLVGDLHPGPMAHAPVVGRPERLPGGWANMLPVLVDLVCRPHDEVAVQKRSAVPAWQWSRAEERGRAELAA